MDELDAFKVQDNGECPDCEEPDGTHTVFLFFLVVVIIFIMIVITRCGVPREAVIPCCGIYLHEMG